MEHFVRCPVCHAELTRRERCFVCPAGHSFDIAAKGYTNLLLNGGENHGDNREMVLSRRRFLEGGFYRPLADAVNAALAELVPPGGGLVLDAGCGEGFYTAAAASSNPGLRFAGIDVSREAIRQASGRPEAKSGRLSLFVAGVYDLPFRDGAFDAILNIFSPFAREEYLRTLRQDGILLSAIPGARHLWELKSVLYDTPYENEIADYTVEGFDFLGKQEVKGLIFLKTPTEIADLFTMTPYYYRTPAAGRERLAQLPSLKTEISFELLRYRRR